MKKIISFAVFTAFIFASWNTYAQAQTQTPGGVNNPNYTWIAWLQPENYNNGVWTNSITGTVGDFIYQNTMPPKINSGYNYHPSVQFLYGGTAASSPYWMKSAQNNNLTTSDNLTTIFVLKRYTDNKSYEGLLAFEAATSQFLILWDSGNENLIWESKGTYHKVGTVTKGIILLDNANTTTPNIDYYLDGLKNSVTTGSNGSYAVNQPIAIASGENDRAYYGYEGEIQEIIILKKSGNGHLDPADLRKIHSYLSIKYGIPLNNSENYVNSAGTVVWDRTANSGYNNQIFGIARDDASGLYQKQSQSQSDNPSLFTAFTGGNVTTLNGDNNGTLDNMVYAMFGNNGNHAGYEYISNPNDQYTGGIKKLNYRRLLKYKVRITGTGNSPESMTVKFKPAADDATVPEYMLISDNENFPVASTKVIPFRGSIVEETLYDGQYISFAEQVAMPGNIGGDVNKIIAWFTPDNYSNGTWVNRITMPGTVGNFTQPVSWSTKTPPSTTVSNFHPAVMFRPSSSVIVPNRMMSDNMIGVTTDDAFTVIMVHKRMQRSTWDYGNVLNFSTGTAVADSYYNAYNISYHNDDGDDIVSAAWTTSRRDLGAVPPGIMHLLTIDNNNTGANGIQWYLGGGLKGTVASQNGSANTAGSGANINDYKIVIGGSHYDIAGDGERSFIGDVQELIILKRNRTSDPFIASAELNKIHSYLAVKYGLTLTTDYITSDGTTVWNSTAGSGAYNNHIFGIARDNGYGLYQKQSQSASFSLFTAFVGNNVTTLNSGNTSGLLDNNVYAMFGNNGQTLNAYTPLTDPAEQYNIAGATRKLNYRLNLSYMVQVTGLTDVLKIKFKPATDVAVPEYMLISTDPTFPVNNTEVIPFLGAIPEKSFSNGVYYISFAGRMTTSDHGPGGVNNNLKLWLRADDEMSVITELLPVGNSKIAGYPDAGTATVVSALSEWKDLVRSHTYSYAMGGTSSHLEPVYQPSNYMTNFHPAVRFWGSSGSVTWLGNTSGIWTTKFPTNNKHSAFFVVNNNFGTHDWIYTLMFGNATSASYNGPGYGVAKSAGNMVGRFRTNGDTDQYAGSGTLNLFTAGATSILGYHHEALGTSSSSKYNIKWRFNGLEDSKNNTLENGSFGLNQESMIGRGYTADRTIQGVISEIIMYDSALSQTNVELIESYLAIKYGITLTPTNHARQRFDYRFSDGTMLWNGTAGMYTKWDTFYNRIAAVIRDDNANLYNRQSHSTNVGSILHLGVAGTRLGTHVDLGYLEHDREAVIWGDDGSTGTTSLNNVNCGDSEQIFNRKWLVRKITNGNRPIRMLVGVEDNSTNQLGQGASNDDKLLFDKLKDNYELNMIVLDPLNHSNGNYKAVVPMDYIDGEHQCAYTFTDTITYITFGYKAKPGGGSCKSDAVFDGTKVFDWSQWTRTNYNIKSITQPAVDLGDGVQVTGTNVTYDNSITVPAYYPSVTGTPVAKSLYLQRRSGNVNSEVTVTVEFNTPVRPEFSIYDIDGSLGCLERVSITGECGTLTGILPSLSHAGNPSSSFYTINHSNATAQASVTRDLSPTDSRGRLNVSFQDGVTKIIIKYSVTDKMHASMITNNLMISPIRLRQIPPPPPTNEDGLSFVKDVNYREITTCDPVEYSFYIENVNCEPKYVNFRDTLPDNVKWKIDISMDDYNANTNPHIKFNEYEGTRVLAIDNLLVPSSGALILTASATLDNGAVPVGETKRFNNHAWIKYEQIIENVTYDRALKSKDRETLADETYFDATWMQRQDTVDTKIETDKEGYSANNEITVTITVLNSNDEITDSYLEILYDAGFQYIANSFSSSITPNAPKVVVPLIDSTLSIAGETDNSKGFAIPQGTSTFTFKLRAPAYANLAHKVDENGQETNDISDLTIDYLCYSEMSDPCVIMSLAEAKGTKQLPYQLLAAYDDTASTISTTPVRIDVLANDSIPDGCTPLLIPISAQHGTPALTSGGDSLQYIADAGFAGYDTITYNVDCSGNVVSAKVFVLVYSKPDNIVEQEDCYEPTKPITFEMREQHRIAGGAHVKNVPLVGDLDGDGIPEIITFGSNADYSNFQVMNVYDGSTKQRKAQVDITDINNSGWISPAPAVLVNSDGDQWGEIIIVNTNKLYSYEAKLTSGVFSLEDKWPSGITYTQSGAGNGSLPQPCVADFNGDGTPELVVYNQIFNANTGALMGTTEAIASAYTGSNTYGQGTTFMTAADFDGDGLPELVAGAAIYKVNISSNGATATCSTLSKNTTVGDGFSAVADVDMDGKLEVVIAKIASSNATLYVWRPDIAGGGAGTYKSYTVTSSTDGASGTHSFPFVGDIDGKEDPVTHKKYPEICLMTVNAVTALEYVQASDSHQQLWKIISSDGSGGTGITLFDFNNDGASELVYRDQDNLRIINGKTGIDDTQLTCGSGTAWEYPVIADSDGDGSANICVACNGSAYDLVIFESNTQPWAPTRKVWNQVNYEPLQINEDLTVPTFPIPKNTEIAGKYPYNGALIQVPLADDEFTIVQLASDPAVDSIWMEEVDASNSKICVRIENRGVKNTNPSLPVALYRGALTLLTPAGGAAYIGSTTAGVSIQPGGKHTLCFTIANTQLEPQMSVRIQDDGTKFPADGSYLDCDNTNNIGAASSLLAVRDYVVTNNKPATFNVLDNDYFGTCGRGALTAFDTIAHSGLKHGALTINADSSFTYTPANSNLLRVDSVAYYTKCGADSSAAKVYIIIQKPLSMKYVACPNASVTMGFEAATGVQYYWYNAATGGSIVTNGNPANTLTITKGSAADIGTWWVEARAGNVVFPRYRVDLEPGDCEVTDPQNCAKDGTVIFREDYGGNNAGDPERSSTPLVPGVVGYNFCNAGSSSSCIQGEGNYAITKKSISHTTEIIWHGGFSDHTFPNDLTKGYMFLVNAGSNPALFYTCQIDNLCPNTNLYFSTWLSNLCRTEYTGTQEPYLKFEISDLSGNILAVYYTGRLPRTTKATGLIWLQYGFPFYNSNNQSVVMKIFNNGAGGNGNDFVMDDIEIRLCAPSVDLGIKDTAVCEGTTLNIHGTYIEDCTFGDELSYRLEFRHTDSINWKTLHSGVETVDCDAADVNDKTLEALKTGWNISSLSPADEGYYRVTVSSSANIDKVNCRAASDSAYVKVVGVGKLADIRVDVCPSISRPIRLSQFLDSLAYNTISWTKVNPASPAINPQTGEINSANLNGTYTYRYSQTSNCGTSSAIAYVHPLKNRFPRHNDTIAICKDEKRSREIQINRILGLELDGGTWMYDNTVLSSYIKAFPASSSYSGALVFDAYLAWTNTAAGYNKFNYRGDVNAKYFVFQYTALAGNCIDNLNKEIVIVVTEKAY